MTARYNVLLISLLALSAAAVNAAPYAVPHQTPKMMPSRAPLHEGHRRYDSGEIAASVARKLTLLEASGQISSTAAVKAHERLRIISKERAALKDRHKRLSAQEERQLSEQLLALDSSLEANRKHPRGLASKWFKWF